MQSNEIIIGDTNLPARVEELAKFILIGREKLTAVRAEIRAIDKVGLAEEVRQQKLSEAQDLGDAVIDAEVRIGELMNAMPKATAGNNPSGLKKVPQIDSTVDLGSDDPFDFLDDVVLADEQTEPVQTKKEIIEEAGLDQKQVERFQILANNPDLVAQAKTEARETGKIVARENVLNKVKAKKKKQQILEAEQSISAQASEELKPVLFVGDCLEYIMTEKYDLLLTDPPYSTDVEDIEQFVNDWLYTALDNVKDTGFAYVFIGAYPEEVKAYLNARLPEHISLCQLLVWTYKNTLGNNPKDRYKQNYQMCLFYKGVNTPDLNCPLTSEQWAVQEVNAPDGRQGDRYHTWQKPIEIAERFIRHSTQPGMTVYDPFACTGTFLFAAAKLGRKAFGCEINPENAEIAFKRGCVHNE